MDGNTYLHELCRTDAPPELVREAVLELGANIDIRNKKDMTPLGVAITSGNSRLVKCLLDLGSEMFFDIDSQRRFNALFLAVYTGQDKVVKTLLENHADIFVNQIGVTPEGKFEGLSCLHIAIKMSRSECVRPLIAAGAFLDMESGPERLTPLQLAAQQNQGIIIARLLEAGAELDQPQSGSGMTALHYAVQSGRSTTVQQLLQAGADVNAVTEAGLTPLMLAAGDGNLILVRMLLDAGAETNIRRLPGNGETALMRAATKNGGLEVIRLLLNSGADPLLTDAFNRTAARLADHSHMVNHYALLKEAEALAEQKFFEKNYRKHRP